MIFAPLLCLLLAILTLILAGVWCICSSVWAPLWSVQRARHWKQPVR